MPPPTLTSVGSVSHDTDGAGLHKTSSSTSVGAEPEPEALEVERLDAGAFASDGLGVGVEGQLAQLEEVEWTCGSGLMGLGVRDYGG